MGVGAQRHAPADLPRERPSTHCVGGWVGPRVGLGVPFEARTENLFIMLVNFSLSIFGAKYTSTTV
jgi:hypothetical protein